MLEHLTSLGIASLLIHSSIQLTEFRYFCFRRFDIRINGNRGFKIWEKGFRYQKLSKGCLTMYTCQISPSSDAAPPSQRLSLLVCADTRAYDFHTQRKWSTFIWYTQTLQWYYSVIYLASFMPHGVFCDTLDSNSSGVFSLSRIDWFSRNVSSFIHFLV